MSALLPLFAASSAAPASAPRAVLTAAQAAAVARDLTAALAAIFSPTSSQYDPALTPDALAADLAILLAAPAGPTPAADQAAALAAFHRPLVARHPLAPATWTLVLDRAACHPALAGHPFAAVAPHLLATFARLPYLRALAAHFDNNPPPADAAYVEPALALHALLSAEPGSALALDLSAALGPVPAASAALPALEAALVTRLRSTLEQTEIDEAAAAFAWLRRLHAAAPLLAAAAPAADAALRAALAPEGVPPAALFRLHLVNRHLIATAPAADALLPAATAFAATAPETFPAARPATRSLAALSRDLASWPEALLADLPEKSSAFVARILVEEHRLRRPAAARAAAFRRLALDFAATTASSFAQLPSALDTLSAREPWRAPEPAAALAALRAALPSLEAAVLLLDRHLALGADTARRAYAAQPAYATKTGPAGEAACAKDNALTLRQLALLLLDGQPQPAERLQAWWSAVVGVHLVNRPPRLFIHNLRCLHAALRAVLPPAGLDLVFGHLHQLYKEAIGIPDSPLLHFGAYLAPALPAPDSAALAAPELRKRHLKRVAALAAAPAAFAPAWTSWLDAPADAALSALASTHGPEPVLRASALLLGDLLRDLGPAHAATRHAAALPERLATRLLADHLDRPAPEDDPCLRDLALTHAYLAEQLRSRPLDHAVLQATRFLLEIVGPHLSEGPEAWAKNIASAHAALDRDCPALARPLLARWTEHLRILGPRLGDLRAFLALAYPAGHPAIAATLAEEKSLRGALTATLFPHLLPANSPWSGARLRALAATDPDAPTRLVAFLDTLFDQLDGAHYYDLVALVSAPVSPAPAASSAAPAPDSPLAAALAVPPAKKGFLGALFGPPPEHLGHDLALAAVLAPAWLAPLLTDLAAAEHRPAANEQLRAWNALAPAAA